MRFTPSLVCVALLLGGSSPASAQLGALTQSETYAGRVSVHLNGGYQTATEEFQQTFQQRAYGEDARLTATNTVGAGAFGDVGGFVQFWERVGIGATYSHMSKSGTTMLTGTVPHPIAFNNARPVNVETQTLRHRERATHFHLSWRIPMSAVEKLDVTVYTGPSFFNLTQGVVTGVVITEPSGPPFATVTIDQITQDEHSRNGWGGHAGVDLTYMWTTHFGLGGSARFAGGSVAVPTENGELSLSVGGFQVGGGLRFRF